MQYVQLNSRLTFSPQPLAYLKTFSKYQPTYLHYFACFCHRALDTSDSTSNSLPSPFKTMNLPVTSPNSKLSLTSPKRGQKREEGWKEVVRRSVSVCIATFHRVLIDMAKFT